MIETLCAKLAMAVDELTAHLKVSLCCKQKIWTFLNGMLVLSPCDFLGLYRSSAIAPKACAACSSPITARLQAVSLLLLSQWDKCENSELKERVTLAAKSRSTISAGTSSFGACATRRSRLRRSCNTLFHYFRLHPYY